MNKVVFIITGIAVLYGLYGLFFDNWTGFYYPDGCLFCEDDYIVKYDMKSKKECLEWAENLQIERNNPNDDFECGRNCKDWGDGMQICEETVDY